MIKQFFGFFLIASTCIANAQSTVGGSLLVKPQENINYFKYPNPPSSGGPLAVDKVNVYYFFNYRCSDCYDYYKQLAKSSNQFVAIKFIPMGFQGYELSSVKWMIVLDQLNIKNYHEKIFDAVKNKELDIDNEINASTFISKLSGIPAKKLLEEYNSGIVKNRVFALNYLYKDYKISSIPALSINDTYFTNFRFVGNNKDAFSSVANLLLTQSYKDIGGTFSGDQKNEKE